MIAAHLSLWQDYLHTTFDLAHIGAELTFTVVFDGLVGALLWPLVKRAVKRHDRKEHGLSDGTPLCPCGRKGCTLPWGYHDWSAVAERQPTRVGDWPEFLTDLP